MARRRYLSTEISIDLAVNRLAVKHSDFAALLYTWLIPHAKDNGTMKGDPEEILAIVVPLRRDKCESDIEAALIAMQDEELITWDREAGIVIFPPTFFKHQSYITEKRRAEASIPEITHKSPPIDTLRDNQRKLAQNSAENIIAPNCAEISDP